MDIGIKTQGYLGKYLLKDRIFSKLSPIFPKNWNFFVSAVIERQIQFADISFYQGVIDWNVMATKASAVIIRAGQNLWIDPQFERNYSEAKQVGMKRGIYWFYDSRINPEEQAILLASMIHDDLPEMEIFCDWEYNYGGNYFDLQYAVRFMIKVEELLSGIKVGMYTGYYFFKDHSDPVKHFVEYDYLKDKPLWLAWYTSNPAYIQIPAPWTNLTHWQYTSVGDGLGWGCESKGLDLNWYNGTVQDFENNYGGVIVEPPPEPGDTMRTIFTNGSSEEVWAEYGYDIHTLIIPPSAIELAGFHYTPGEGHYVEDHVNNEYKMFFNFTPYNFADDKVNEGLKINGTSYHEYVDYDPWLEWLNKSPRITHVKSQWKNVSTGSQGFRYIFENGVITPTANSEWNKRYAQRIVANDTNGNTIIFSSTGEPEGLTLYEVADIFKRWVVDGHGEYPIDYALQGDSGHSVQTGYYKDHELQVFVGAQDGNLNAPVSYGYIRLNSPFITKEEPPVEPPPSTELPEIPVEIVLGDDVDYEKQVISTVLKPVK